MRCNVVTYTPEIRARRYAFSGTPSSDMFPLHLKCALFLFVMNFEQLRDGRQNY